MILSIIGIVKNGNENQNHTLKIYIYTRIFCHIFKKLIDDSNVLL